MEPKKRKGMTIKNTQKQFSDCLDDNTSDKEETLYYITTFNCHNLEYVM